MKRIFKSKIILDPLSSRIYFKKSAKDTHTGKTKKAITFIKKSIIVVNYTLRINMVAESM